MEFEAFDSLEEMMARLNEQTLRADAQVRPWQARIKTGDYFRRSSGYGFDIYGEVLPEGRGRGEPVGRGRPLPVRGDTKSLPGRALPGSRKADGRLG